MTMIRHLRLKRMHCIVVQPPPINGMTLVSQQLISGVKDNMAAKVHLINNARPRVSIMWTLSKHHKFFRAIISSGLESRGKEPCYFILDSQKGLWLNLLEAPLLRVFFSEVWLHHHVFSYIKKRDLRVSLILAILGTKVRHISLGQEMTKGLREHYDAKSMMELGNATFVSDVSPYIARKSLRTIGFLGNITTEKGVHLFLKLIDEIQISNPDVECVIAGPVKDVSLRKVLKNFCNASGAKRVWLGPVTGKDKEAFFDSLDLLIFPSLYENEALPVTIYEALAAGIPVLATSRGCIPEQLEGSDWVIDERDFIGRARDKIQAWIEDGESYNAASRRAGEISSMKKARDEARRQTLIEKMQMSLSR
jgi:glycosyltransferase involved in cell wall biosynthesis